MPINQYLFDRDTFSDTHAYLFKIDLTNRNHNKSIIIKANKTG